MADNILVVTATPNPDGQQALGEYLSKVVPLFQAAGGQLIVRCKTSAPIAGEPGFAMLMVMRFADAKTIHDAFASDSYQALIKVRNKAFSKIDIVIGDDTF